MGTGRADSNARGKHDALSRAPPASACISAAGASEVTFLETMAASSSTSTSCSIITLDAGPRIETADGSTECKDVIFAANLPFEVCES